jgi:thermitase
VTGAAAQRPVRQTTPESADAHCFSETHACVGDTFYAYWQAHGGLALNGYPISNEFTEGLGDGKIYTVQYFERARFEHHPENAPPYDVLLGQFGRRFLGQAR